MKNELPIKGQIAVVTGGARGIGQAIAERLARDGADIALIDIDYERVRATAALMNANGFRAVAIQADVGRYGDVVRAFELVISQLGSPDILVNNAGIYTSTPLLEVTPEEWKRTIDTNLNGVFYCSQGVAPYLMAKKSGRIVNIASISGKVAWPRSQAYSASKSGVMGLTRALARDLAPYNVTVNAICPGDTNTDMLIQVDKLVSQAEGLDPGTFIRETVKHIPLNRYAEPFDIAALAAFLVSPEARHLTGQAINVDGGAVMW